MLELKVAYNDKGGVTIDTDAGDHIVCTGEGDIAEMMLVGHGDNRPYDMTDGIDGITLCDECAARLHELIATAAMIEALGLATGTRPGDTVN